MSSRARAAARKFWEVVPNVMRAIFAETRRGGHNLAPNHFRILRALSVKSCNLSELAEHQDVSLPSMSSTVQTLVERGWLTRERSLDDRRAVDLRVTPKGHRVLADEYERLLSWMAKRLESLDHNEIERVEQGLDTLLHLFEEVRTSTHVEQINEKV